MRQKNSKRSDPDKTPVPSENVPPESTPAETNPGEADSALVSALERLAFRLHDFANRLLGYLR